VNDAPNDEMTHDTEAVSAAGCGPQRRDGAGAGAQREGHHRRPIAYVVLPNAAEPFLLARVRWPDVYQAISAARPDWQDDPGLFDLPYAPTSTAVTYEEAVEIAGEWGARIPSDEEGKKPGPSLIRRMPSDWQGLSTAERRAWAIEIGRPTRQPVAAPTAETAPATKRRPWGRRRVEPVLASSQAAFESPPSNRRTVETLVLDLTEPAETARAAVEFA
jgi:hypothetical protein